MGADFVFAMAEVTQPKDYWLDYISHMDDSHMESFIATTDELFYWSDRFDDMNPYSPEFYQAVAEAVSRAVEVCYDYEYNRELGWWTRDDRSFIVTGGTTYGDAPTDAMSSVEVFEALQHWDEARRPEADDEPATIRPNVFTVDMRHVNGSEGQLLIESYPDGQVHVAHRPFQSDRWNAGMWMGPLVERFDND